MLGAQMLVPVLLFATASAWAAPGDPWIDREKHGSKSTDWIMERVRKEPAERAQDALNFLTWRGSLCTETDIGAELLELGANPDVGIEKVHSVPWEGGFAYTTSKPLFWVAISECPTVDYATQLLTNDVDPTLGWAEKDVQIPKERNEVLLGERRGEARWSWLTWLLLEDVPVTHKKLAIQAYTDIAERGVPTEQQRAKDNLRYGHRRPIQVFLRYCAESDPMPSDCTGDDSRELVRALAKLHMTYDLDGHGVVSGALPWIVRMHRYDLAAILAEEGLDLTQPFPTATTKDGKEIYPARWESMTFADWLFLECDAPSRDAFLAWTDAHGGTLTTLKELQEKVGNHLGQPIKPNYDMPPPEITARVQAACIGRGVAEETCTKHVNPNMPLGLSAADGWWGVDRVRAAELAMIRWLAVMNPWRAASTVEPHLMWGSENWFSLGALEAAVNDVVVASKAASCGPYLGSSPPPSTPPGCTGEGCAAYGEVLEPFYAKYPSCPR